ncbi:MAG: hypothetical protein KDE27_29065 [Planctomycetes bacterium]|nr:hypothetical protein [Planctomycetota bacterium]
MDDSDKVYELTPQLLTVSRDGFDEALLWQARNWSRGGERVIGPATVAVPDLFQQGFSSLEELLVNIAMLRAGWPHGILATAECPDGRSRIIELLMLRLKFRDFGITL